MQGTRTAQLFRHPVVLTKVVLGDQVLGHDGWVLAYCNTMVGYDKEGGSV